MSFTDAVGSVITASGLIIPGNIEWLAKVKWIAFGEVGATNSSD